jgi:hypothetical protein
MMLVRAGAWDIDLTQTVGTTIPQLIQIKKSCRDAGTLFALGILAAQARGALLQ